jgi:glutaredoxin
MELTLFYRPGCPYCRRAEELLGELTASDPALAAVPIRRVDETADPAEAESRDYWYVPSLFLGERKLYEASPLDSPKKMRAALETALREAARA